MPLSQNETGSSDEGGHGKGEGEGGGSQGQLVRHLVYTSTTNDVF